MRALIVGAGLWLAPLCAWAGDATTDSGPAYLDLFRPPDATLAAACRRLELEGPGEYCVEWPWSKDDVLGCLQDASNPKPNDRSLCTHLTSAREHCCKGWRGAGWRDACRDSQTALWCRERKADDPANPAWPQSSGCALAGTAVRGAELALGLTLLVAAGLARSRRRLSLAAVACLAFAPSTTHADVATPPPPPACSRYQAEGPDEYCIERPTTPSDGYGCQRDPANPRPPPGYQCDLDRDLPRELCCRSWLAAGWWFDCTAYGVAGSYALWCRKRQPGDPPRPELWQESGGCALGRTAAVGSVAGALLLALLALGGLLHRRRSRGE